MSGLVLLSFSLEISNLSSIGLSWVTKINDSSAGLLDIALALAVVGPFLYITFQYMSQQQ